MNRALVIFALALAGMAAAQTAPSEGRAVGGYRMHQTIDMGVRVVDVRGNEAAYSTFDNRFTGPRLLEHSLELRPLRRGTGWFDSLSVTALGLGGEPAASVRARVEKDGVYSFRADVRRSRNYFDFNSLANPFNPVAGTLVTESSPHRTDLVRRQSDYSVVLRPKSLFRVRGGFGRTVEDAEGLTTWHLGERLGTEFALDRLKRRATNSYRLGVDLRGKKTQLVFDETVEAGRVRPVWELAGAAGLLPNGQPADNGLIRDPANQFCDPFTAGGAVNPFCNGLLTYFRRVPQQNRRVTEQLYFKSQPGQRFELTARGSYSRGRIRSRDVLERSTGWEFDGNSGEIGRAGALEARQAIGAADVAATAQVTDWMAFTQTFRWNRAQNRSMSALEQQVFFASSLLGPIQTSPNCPAPFTAMTCPPHRSDSPADRQSDALTAHFSHRTLASETAVELSAASVGMRVGYQVAKRTIAMDLRQSSDLLYLSPFANRGACAGGAVDASGNCTATANVMRNDLFHVTAHGPVVSGWAEASMLRVRAAYDGRYANDAYAQISPTRQHRGKLGVDVEPGRPVRLSVDVSGRSARNAFSGNRESQQGVSFTGHWLPAKKWSLYGNFQYDSSRTMTPICYSTFAMTADLPCPNSGLLGTVAYYDGDVKFTDVQLQWQATNRLALDLGYAGSFADTRALRLHNEDAAGPYRFTYHQPAAGVSYRLRDGLTARAFWNPLQYREDMTSITLSPRHFRAQRVLLSVRHAF